MIWQMLHSEALIQVLFMAIFCLMCEDLNMPIFHSPISFGNLTKYFTETIEYHQTFSSRDFFLIFSKRCC